MVSYVLILPPFLTNQAVRCVSLLAGGFVQIPPRSLRLEEEILLSFSTNNQSGIVLAGFSDDQVQRQVNLTVMCR